MTKSIRLNKQKRKHKRSLQIFLRIMNKTIHILKQLVQIQSYSGNENNLAEYIFKIAKEHHLDVEEHEGNIVIKFLNSSSKCLVFNAHMDTVKEGNIDLWSDPPFGEKAGIVKDGKLYGLGASDDKAGVAALLSLALELKNDQPPLNVFFTFVKNEEIDGSGSEAFVSYFKKNYANNYSQKAAILSEPTDLTSIEIGNRGNAFIKITTQGDSGIIFFK